MIKPIVALLSLSLSLLFSSIALANDTAATGGRILFVYDTIDKSNRFYVEAIRAGLAQTGLPVDEASSPILMQKDPSAYDRIVIYGMTMAFNMKSMVRTWLKAQKELTGRNVHIFVTANRWFGKNLHRDLVKLATEKKATVVDAVTMATGKASDADKKEKIRSFIANLGTGAAPQP